MEEGPSELHFPFEYEELKPEERTEIQKLFKSPNVDFVSVGPKKYKVHRRYKDEAANIYNMPLRNSDIFVITYQRSRTTWTQELVWLLAKDFDYDTAKAIPLAQRYPFLEIFMFFDKQWKEHYRKNISADESFISMIEPIATPVTGPMLSMPSPRLIKSHLPLKVLDTAKLVYVARDPRDVAVSCYHHARLFKSLLDFTGTFKEFWNLFIRDMYILTPYFEHIKEAWENRNHPNMLFLFYENLSKLLLLAGNFVFCSTFQIIFEPLHFQDLPSAVRRVADFLGKDPTLEEISGLCDHLSFENFQNNDSVNFEELRDGGYLATGEEFIRKGLYSAVKLLQTIVQCIYHVWLHQARQAGGWRDYFDEEMTQQAERWMADNLRDYRDTDLRFPNV